MTSQMKTIGFMLVSCASLVLACGSLQPLHGENEAAQPVSQAAAIQKPSPVKKITTVLEYAKSHDWCGANNLITIGKQGSDGYSDVYVMKPDGSGEECLTCDKPGCPQKHNGNPAWHPSGKFIVFTAEKKENSKSKKAKQFAQPGTGINCDLWLMTSDGEKFMPLTNLPVTVPSRGVIHPQFSHSGKKLLWVERVGKGDPWGEYALKVADFVIDDKKPRLENIKTYQPGKQPSFYEGHGFSPDDKKILFSGDLQPGQKIYGMDIYTLDLETEQLQRLTETPNYWDEHAHYSPNGKKIAWMSSSGFNANFKSVEGHAWKKYLITELWVMDADGANKQRLTFFNQSGHKDFMGTRAVVSDSSWSPDGKKILATVAFENRRGRMVSKIVLIDLDF